LRLLDFSYNCASVRQIFRPPRGDVSRRRFDETRELR
jgi:hypothetical protein